MINELKRFKACLATLPTKLFGWLARCEWIERKKLDIGSALNGYLGRIDASHFLPQALGTEPNFHGTALPPRLLCLSSHFLVRAWAQYPGTQ